jgi:hypothetical protein
MYQVTRNGCQLSGISKQLTVRSKQKTRNNELGADPPAGGLKTNVNGFGVK